MSLQKISQPAALSPGALLWVVPDSPHSSWTRKIDWYLNFQMANSLKRESATFAPQLNKILQANEMDPPPVACQSDSPLLIASSTRFPNLQTIQVSYHNDIQKWTHTIFNIWKALNFPSLRIFLPETCNTDQFIEAWAHLDKECLDVSYLPGDLTLNA